MSTSEYTTREAQAQEWAEIVADTLHSSLVIASDVYDQAERDAHTVVYHADGGDITWAFRPVDAERCRVDVDWGEAQVARTLEGDAETQAQDALDVWAEFQS